MKRLVNGWRYWLRAPGQFRFGRLARHCPICGHAGVFYAAGQPPRYDARCPSCRSRERHRLVQLYFDREGIDPRRAGAFLHIAPEPHFARLMAGCANYHSLDLAPGRARHCADMQDLPFADNTFDWAMAHHVLEHVVDDRRALAELYRVLKPGGRALLSVPQNFSRQDTYEDAAVQGPAQAFAHYGDPLHVRLYGRDFAQRVSAAGFMVQPWRLEPKEEVYYGLRRDDVLYVCCKPAPAQEG